MNILLIMLKNNEEIQAMQILNRTKLGQGTHY